MAQRNFWTVEYQHVDLKTKLYESDQKTVFYGAMDELQAFLEHFAKRPYVGSVKIRPSDATADAYELDIWHCFHDSEYEFGVRRMYSGELLCAHWAGNPTTENMVEFHTKLQKNGSNHMLYWKPSQREEIRYE